MTKTTPERLGVLEEQVREVKTDVKEIKHLLQKQESKYVLRREATVAIASLSTVIAAIGLYVTLESI